jgi:prepilin peptidase CpaA
MPSFLVAILVLTFPALVIAAALRDAMSYTIPNWISAALVVLFPVAALAAGFPMSAIALHVGVGVAMLAVGMVMFALRWVGGGDAKLVAAAALWLGWPALTGYLLTAALAGGGLAAVLILMRSTLFRPLALMGPPWVARLAEPGEPVPYGVAICIGALVALPASPFGAVLGL